MKTKKKCSESLPDLYTAGTLMTELESSVLIPSRLKILKKTFQYVSEEEVKKAIFELRKVYNLGKSRIYEDQ